MIPLIRPIDYDFGFLHIKAVDDAGHDKSLEKKITFLEKADQALAHFIKGLLESKSENV